MIKIRLRLIDSVEQDLDPRTKYVGIVVERWFGHQQKLCTLEYQQEDGGQWHEAEIVHE